MSSDRVLFPGIAVASSNDPVLFGEKLALSQSFLVLFREGMSLVEQTAAYLDGQGREESKGLDRSAALHYATESMRLTTRLMHVASWLLLQRAVNEGELSPEDAGREKTKVRIASLDPVDPDILALLPPRLVELIEQSFRLHDRVQHLDAAIYNRALPEPEENVVANQIDRLRAAFGSKQ